MQLNEKNIPNLHSGIVKPGYGRAALSHAIVHIGIGGFHRAHLAFYQDQLLSSGTSDWAICGIGMRPEDARMHEILKRQDFLYTLMVKHPEGRLEPGVIGSITDFILTFQHPEQAIAKLADAFTRIVSLTITEGGYNFDEHGAFIADNANVQWDIQNRNAPKTVFGLLAAALQLRKSKGQPPFTVMSCDNIQNNGDMCKRMLLSFTRLFDPELAGWIEKEVAFPNCMVDRITPVTTTEDIQKLQQQFGIEDGWPVTCEPFIQWVLEDHFPGGRPRWEQVGVQFVKEIAPYEKMKLRLLNGSHILLSVIGLLYGYRTVDEVLRDSDIRELLIRFMATEVMPILDPVEGIDLNDYQDSLIERFSNAYIKDQLTRVASESTAKMPKFLIPTVKDQLDRGGDAEKAIFGLAAWCVLFEREGEPGFENVLIDEQRDKMKERAMNSTEDPLAFLSHTLVFGDLMQNEKFVKIYQSHLDRIRTQGIQSAVQYLLQ
ncbi:mannitol dehydrogenase family protein [Niabella aurantiaca]|uniref:mannitol dehydrogenase family protein n=1 Tax=Niabella aurantiaca TaxID=379900 RepID=UPI0003701881|nr:mannitol dehydrogenase family protein [Niabella aurantiaca]